MADGFECDKTDAYFSGRLKLPPTPKKIDRHLAKEKARKKSTYRTSNDGK